MVRLFFVFCLVSANTFAVDYQSPLDKFFQLFKAGRPDNAVEQLYLFNRDRNETDVSMVSEQKHNELVEATTSLGLFYGQELLGKHQIGKRLNHVTYMLYFQNGPVRLEFEFYRPQEKWRLTDLNIDNHLSSELKAMARRDIAGFVVKKDLEKLEKVQ